jgi:hypothetical protein
MAADRFDELKRKAASEGLTDEEAAELGRLYADERGETYQDSKSVDDADAALEDEESQERRELDAAAKAKAAEEARARPSHSRSLVTPSDPGDPTR